MNVSRIPFAHSGVGPPPVGWEPLREHLLKVAARTERFADAFGAGDWGYLAGLWHDVGKYQEAFQRRLLGSGEHVEHAGAGALLAAKRAGVMGRLLAFAMAGHHAGLPNRAAGQDSGLAPLEERMRRNVAALTEVLACAERDIVEAPVPATRPGALAVGGDPGAARRTAEMWTRFLFSAVVDADRLETEAFYNPVATARRTGYPTLAELSSRLDAHMVQFRPDTIVNQCRARVLTNAHAAAVLPAGFFTFCAPTGSGKTLSGLAFALRHSLHHGLRRVVVAVPYTSIIEQTAKVYRDAVGEGAVVEHHASIDEQRRMEVNRAIELRRQAAVENWDAPLIVTTTVQLFESLLSNRPSGCRKLHNVARSVIILDEAQSLPAGYLECLLDALKELVSNFGCSVVVATATQPALQRRDSLPQGLPGSREIVSDPVGLAAALRRVRVSWPEPGASPMRYDEVAKQVAQYARVLVIVHRRADARRLANLLPEEGRFHLSALMCAAHRSEVLSTIRDRLAESGLCRVIATQLVEAGVDIDFPVVFRALAGLDSVAQAAGRCNREGKLAAGEVVVFRAETPPPPGILRLGLESAEAMLVMNGAGLDLADPLVYETYFRMLFAKADLDRMGVQAEREQLNFATVAQRVRLVEDGYSVPVVVNWGQGSAQLASYESQPSREGLRALQPYLVQVPRRNADSMTRAGTLYEVQDGLFALAPGHGKRYDGTFGLLLGEDADADSLIV